MGWAYSDSPTFIPYFTAYLIHYFYNSKTIGATAKSGLQIWNQLRKETDLKKYRTLLNASNTSLQDKLFY